MINRLRRAGLPMLMLVLMVLSFMLMSSVAGAQGNEVVIKLSVPNFAQDLFSEDYLAQFEAENPGIRVILDNASAEFSYTEPSRDLEAHFEGVEKYVSSADVLFVDASNLSVEATRAGFFLDLSPLVSVDSTLN